MSRLFVGNFEFEHQLAARDSSLRLRSVPRTAVELSAVWLSIARDEDVLWMPEPLCPDFSQQMADQGFCTIRWVTTRSELDELSSSRPLGCCPWGWSAPMLDWAKERKLAVDPPPLDAVRSANSRRFSFRLEQELGVGLETASEITSLEELATALPAFAGDKRWVLKSEFGMSGRERLLGRGSQLTANQLSWAKNRLPMGQALFLEPWVFSLAEAGLQFEIPKPGAGEPQCLGITPMLTDASGVYRGSRFDLPPQTDFDWSQAVEVGQSAARQAQELGYFGPLGIDAMWYVDYEGTPKLRPLQDLNARWTMGRLSLGFRWLLAADEAGLWLHFRCPAKTPEAARDWWHRLPASLPDEVRLVRTSPLTTGGQVTRHATAVLIAPDAGLLQTAVAIFNSQSEAPARET
jgi:hypothetical protein